MHVSRTSSELPESDNQSETEYEMNSNEVLARHSNCMTLQLTQDEKCVVTNVAFSNDSLAQKICMKTGFKGLQSEFLSFIVCSVFESQLDLKNLKK